MGNKNKNTIPTPEQLGIPTGGYDPLKTIEMEGDFMRGLIKNKPKSFIVRIAAIMMGIFYITIAALLFGVFFIDLPQGDEIIAAVYMIFLGILFLIIGLKIIKSNIKLSTKRGTILQRYKAAMKK